MVVIQGNDLKQRADEVLRRLRETGEPIEIVDEGRTIAKLVAADDASGVAAESSTAKDAETAAIWDELERLSLEIGRRWPAGVSAAEAERDDRREL